MAPATKYLFWTSMQGSRKSGNLPADLAILSLNGQPEAVIWTKADRLAPPSSTDGSIMNS